MKTSIVLCACLALVAGPAAAQQAFYPAKHQSQAKQEKDRTHCDKWAVDQSGFNPQYAYAPQKKTGAVAKGALIGGGVGGVAGSFNANAGKGLLAGAAVGGLIGGVKQHSENKKAQEAHDAAQARYDNAYAACMKGRGYTDHTG